MQRRHFLQSALATTLLARPGAASSGEGTSRLLAVDSVGSSLDFIDVTTFAREGRVRLGKRPREIAVSPDGSVAYVSIYGPGIYGANPMPGHEIAVIDVKGMRLSRLIDVRPHAGPHGLAVAPDGLLWATNETEGALVVINPAAKPRARAVVAAVSIGVKGPHWIAITPDGEKVYAASKDNPVLSVVDVRSRRLVNEIKVSGGLEGLAVAVDGRRLYAASLTRATLLVVDISSDRPLREFPMDEPGGRILPTPDGRGLLISHYASGTVEMLEIPTLRRRGVVRVGRSPSGLATSRDGKTGYVASWADGTISVVDLASLRVLRTVRLGGGPDGMAAVEV
jgi:YVTN family beta-propeller protein